MNPSRPFILRPVATTLLMVAILILIVRCDDSDCDHVRDTYGSASYEYQRCAHYRGSGGGGTSWGGSSGSSWGGYSSGGSHK